jgi:hypothetical protein
MSLSHEVRRIKERLSERVAELKAQPRPHVVTWAARLYGETDPRVMELMAAPDDPALVAEFRLDQFLMRPETWDMCEENILRAIAIHTSAADPAPPREEPYNILPGSDSRFPRLWVSRMFARFGERLLVHGKRLPETWPECFWCAAEAAQQGDDELEDDDVVLSTNTPRTDQAARLFLAAIGDEVKAIRVTGDLVECRGFSEPWTVAGKVPPSTPI